MTDTTNCPHCGAVPKADTALTRYLARPDADERVRKAAIQSQESHWKSYASEYREHVYREACSALAEELERVVRMLQSSICDDVCRMGPFEHGACSQAYDGECQFMGCSLAVLRTRCEEAKND